MWRPRGQHNSVLGSYTFVADWARKSGLKMLVFGGEESRGKIIEG